MPKETNLKDRYNSFMKKNKNFIPVSTPLI